MKAHVIGTNCSNDATGLVVAAGCPEEAAGRDEAEAPGTMTGQESIHHVVVDRETTWAAVNPRTSQGACLTLK